MFSFEIERMTASIRSGTAAVRAGNEAASLAYMQDVMDHMAVLANSTASSSCLAVSAKAVTQYIQTDVIEACSLNVSRTAEVAKQHGPIIVKLLRTLTGCLTACAQLTSEVVKSPTDPTNQNVIAHALATTASAALDAMDVLRSVMKGGSHELDVQRYNFVRRFLQLGLHQCAFQQGILLVDRTFIEGEDKPAASVSGHIDGTEPSDGARLKGAAAVQISGGISDLQLAAITSLMVCVGEMVSTDQEKTVLILSSCAEPLHLSMSKLR